MNIISDTIQSLTSMRQRQVLYFLFRRCLGSRTLLSPAEMFACVYTWHNTVSKTHIFNMLRCFRFFWLVISGLLPGLIEADVSIDFTHGFAVGPSSYKFGTDCNFGANDLEISYGSHKQRKSSGCCSQVDALQMYSPLVLLCWREIPALCLQPLPEHVSLFHLRVASVSNIC